MKKRGRVQQQQQLDIDTSAQSLQQRTLGFLKQHLSQIQDFVVKNVRPVHLAIFYFFGAYYNFSKRLTGIRYVSICLTEERKGSDD